MRKLIIATAALAFLSSTAFAQGTTAPAAKGGDTMSKGDDASKDKMSKKTTKKSKKSAKKSTDDTTK